MPSAGPFARKSEENKRSLNQENEVSSGCRRAAKLTSLHRTARRWLPTTTASERDKGTFDLATAQLSQVAVSDYAARMTPSVPQPAFPGKRLTMLRHLASHAVRAPCMCPPRRLKHPRVDPCAASVDGDIGCGAGGREDGAQAHGSVGEEEDVLSNRMDDGEDDETINIMEGLENEEEETDA
ncbi:hypothetical protein C0995_003330 [Termitomyces sp. Mi166|nr:hypothetical protein C0995_003330 [Termitomyces sp. Mi166\